MHPVMFTVLMHFLTTASGLNNFLNKNIDHNSLHISSSASTSILRLVINHNNVIIFRIVHMAHLLLER